MFTDKSISQKFKRAIGAISNIIAGNKNFYKFVLDHFNSNITLVLFGSDIS